MHPMLTNRPLRWIEGRAEIDTGSTNAAALEISTNGAGKPADNHHVGAMHS